MEHSFQFILFPHRGSSHSYDLVVMIDHRFICYVHRGLDSQSALQVLTALLDRLA